MADLNLSRREAAMLIAAAATSCVAAPAADLRIQARDAMKRATRFMTERAAHRGGYVWSYLPDFSRRWGEMEAFPTMQWVQPPGTATMGHVFLDAYFATDDDLYLDAAYQTADALIAGQHPSGGWNYMIDTAGEASLRRWYDTIGKNGWRLEEFHHYYGNATFDDAGTAEATLFLLRLPHPSHSGPRWDALKRAISFILDSQYENGGWPQRFPRTEAAHLHGGADYTGHVTFNDDVASENLRILSIIAAFRDPQSDYPNVPELWAEFGARIESALARGRACFLLAQQPAPQAGWSLQYTLDMQPAAARSYEPLSLSTHTTVACISRCFDFFVETGDRRFLARLPDALDWLDSVRLPDTQIRNNRAYPTFVEIGSNRARIVHRRGSNVVNGAYFWDYEFERPITHYSQARAIDMAGLRSRLASLQSADEAALAALRDEVRAQRRRERVLFVAPMATSDLNAQDAVQGVNALIASLNAEGYWPTPLTATSNPYIGDGPATPAPGDFAQTLVGDSSDTSPYTTDTPVIGISTGAYIENMSALIRFVRGGA